VRAPAERLREAVAEVDVGHELFAAGSKEAAASQVCLDALERRVRRPELEHG
jgi:hypothetical protein